MKNKLVKSFLIVSGMASLMLGFQNVNADTCGKNGCSGSSGFDLSPNVGTVETPVYYAKITWDDLIFNWVYNSVTKEFEWKVNPSCNYFNEDGLSSEDIVNNALANGTILYSDDSCTKVVESYDESYVYYEKMDNTEANIHIEDSSVAGEIIPSITWNPESNYDFVEGHFTYTGTKCTAISNQEELNSALEINVPVYSNSDCNSKVEGESITFEEGKYYAFMKTSGIELKEGSIPDDARQYDSEDAYTKFTEQTKFPKNKYHLIFSLKNSSEKESKTPVAGEKIGTITVNLESR